MLIAVALAEPSTGDILVRLANHDLRLIGLPSVLEARMVLAGRRPGLSPDAIDDLLQSLAVQAVDFTMQMERAAWRAWQRFGKGRHPAALNFGDCMSYGVAHALNLPLLFIGDDFVKTDMAVA